MSAPEKLVTFVTDKNFKYSIRQLEGTSYQSANYIWKNQRTYLVDRGGKDDGKQVDPKLTPESIRFHSSNDDFNSVRHLSIHGETIASQIAGKLDERQKKRIRTIELIIPDVSQEFIEDFTRDLESLGFTNPELKVLAPQRNLTNPHLSSESALGDAESRALSDEARYRQLSNFCQSDLDVKYVQAVRPEKLINIKSDTAAVLGGEDRALKPYPVFDVDSTLYTCKDACLDWLEQNRSTLQNVERSLASRANVLGKTRYDKISTFFKAIPTDIQNGDQQEAIKLILAEVGKLPLAESGGKIGKKLDSLTTLISAVCGSNDIYQTLQQATGVDSTIRGSLCSAWLDRVPVERSSFQQKLLECKREASAVSFNNGQKNTEERRAEFNRVISACEGCAKDKPPQTENMLFILNQAQEALTSNVDVQSKLQDLAKLATNIKDNENFNEALNQSRKRTGIAKSSTAGYINDIVAQIGNGVSGLKMKLESYKKDRGNRYIDSTNWLKVALCTVTVIPGIVLAVASCFRQHKQKSVKIAAVDDLLGELDTKTTTESKSAISGDKLAALAEGELGQILREANSEIPVVGDLQTKIEEENKSVLTAMSRHI